MNTNQMNRHIGICIAFLLFLVSCEKIVYYHEDGTEITAAEAVKIVQPIIDEYAEDGRFWSIGKKPIPARTTLKYGPFGNYNPSSEYCGVFKSPDFKAWLIAIGPDMNLNGLGNGSLILFVNLKTGKYVEMSIDGEVSGIEWDDSFNTVLDDPSFLYDSLTSDNTKERGIRSRSLPSTSGLYAVIISGGVKKEYNYSRYWYDCQYIFQRLTQTLGYDESNIYCLVADGTNPSADMMTAPNTYISSPLDFDNDGDNDIQYSATITDISTVFNLLQTSLPSIDHLLVFITDHGDPNGLCLWGNNQIMSPAELNAELNKVSGVGIDIVLGQCYSGVYIPTCSATNRTITTACSATEESVGNGFLYDYFLRSWTDAFDPSNASMVNTNADSIVSLKEAFEYACAHDPAALCYLEHPQYSSAPLIYGYTHDLLGADNRPVITGSDYLSCNFSSSFTISGLPSGTSVTWDSTGNMTLTSATNTSVNAQGFLSDSSAYVATNEGILAFFTLEGTLYSITKSILSIWKPGVYSGSHIFGGSGEYIVESGLGSSGFFWTCSNPSWVILGQGSSIVHISETPTSAPVTLAVTFQDPWGNNLVVYRQFN